LAVVFGFHTKQWVISVLGVVYEIKERRIWRSRLSVRRETFFRFMEFSRGVYRAVGQTCVVQFCSVTVISPFAR